MTTYLQITKDTRLECDIPGTGPTSVSDTNKEMQKLLHWVRKSWVEIQSMFENWRWLRVEFEFETTFEMTFTSGGTTTIAIGDVITGDVSGSTATLTAVNVTSGSFAAGDAEGTLEFATQSADFVAEGIEVSSVNVATIEADAVRGKDTYDFGDATDILTSPDPIVRFKDWIVEDVDNPPKIYLSSSGVGTEYWMAYTTWAKFRTIYKIGTVTPGPPVHIAVNPQNQLVIGPPPESNTGIYRISGEYQKSAQILSADGDEPECPSDYHDAIMWMAVEKYARQEAADELIASAMKYGGKFLNRLRRNQLPKTAMGDPLA